LNLRWKLSKGCFPRVEKRFLGQRGQQRGRGYCSELKFPFFLFSLPFSFWFSILRRKNSNSEAIKQKPVSFWFYFSHSKRRICCGALCFNYAAVNWTRRERERERERVFSSPLMAYLGVLWSVSGYYWLSFWDSIFCRLIPLQTHFSKILFCSFLNFLVAVWSLPNFGIWVLGFEGFQLLTFSLLGFLSPFLRNWVWNLFWILDKIKPLFCLCWVSCEMVSWVVCFSLWNKNLMFFLQIGLLGWCGV